LKDTILIKGKEDRKKKVLISSETILGRHDDGYMRRKNKIFLERKKIDKETLVKHITLELFGRCF